LAAENQEQEQQTGAANTHLPVIGDFGAALPHSVRKASGFPTVDSN